MFLFKPLRLFIDLVLIVVAISALIIVNITPLTSALEFAETAVQGDGADVSCANSGYCMAVGSSIDSSGFEQPLTLVRHGGLWQSNVLAGSIIDRVQGRLDAVSCVSDSYCAALGTYQPIGANQMFPLLVVFNNGVGQAVSLPLLGTVRFPTSISCSSENFCLLGGSVALGNARAHAFIYSLRDTQVQEVVSGSGRLDEVEILNDIDCVEDDHCLIASGRVLYETMPFPTEPSILVYKDGDVSAQTLDEPEMSLATISCDIQTCRGIVTGSSNQLFVEWQPLGWDEYGAPPVSTEQVQSIRFNSIDCPSNQDCVLIGTGDVVGQEHQLFAHGVSGMRKAGDWRVDRVEPQSAKLSILQSVSCVSSQDCVAVGLYMSGIDGQTKPYIAEYDGEVWRAAHPFETEQSSGILDSTVAMVAFGDSITTGFSIPGCVEDREVSAWGCVGAPNSEPYPERLATDLGYDLSEDLMRTGIWGYTAREAALDRTNGRNNKGTWQPQLKSAETASELVVGGLGINDLRFSDVLFWVKQYYHPSGNKVSEAAQQIIVENSVSFDQIFTSLQMAKSNGAEVIVTLYYNPYDTSVPFCGDLENIGDGIVDTLDQELAQRARAKNMLVADFRQAFTGHGAGSDDPYVFGSQCKTSSAIANWLPAWLGGGGGVRALGAAFDPHPNNKGAEEMVKIIRQELVQ